jgi:hypothetical protein
VYNIQRGNTDIEINFYMCINDEKGKSREDYVELGILYLIWVLGAPYHQGGYSGELVKCKTSKIYPTTKNSCQARHIRSPTRILDTLAGHVRAPGQTCPASQPYPGLTKHIRLLGRISEAFPGHIWSNPIPQQLSTGPNISDPQADFQRGWSDMSEFLTPQRLDSLGGYKRPSTPL